MNRIEQDTGVYCQWCNFTTQRDGKKTGQYRESRMFEYCACDLHHKQWLAEESKMLGV
jgi:hypothetical protein